MEFLQKVQLAPYTTFALAAETAWFCRVNEKAEISQALLFAYRNNLALMPLGSGSNLVLTRDFPGLIIKLDMAGIEKLDEGPSSVLVRMHGGQDWSSAVEYCLDHGWYGLENLAMIPGTAGGAPVQNIGAYGLEISDRLVDLQAIETSTGLEKNFSSEQCGFGYRTSRFKKAQGRWIITSITLRLRTHPMVDTHYGALDTELERLKIQHPTPKDVYDAVCSIRRSKLPDPAKTPNVGSFFTNPVVDHEKFYGLKERFNDIVAFENKDGSVKIAAAWLIEKCGFKGVEQGQVGVHHLQPLILVNKGQATAKQVLALADQIKKSVEETFGISLEYEPRIL